MAPRFMAALLALAAGCGSNAANGVRGDFDACNAPGVDPRCGSTCTADADCGDDLFCGTGGTCTAECIHGGSQCDPGLTCGAGGHCVVDDGSGGGGNGDGGNECPRINVNAAPTIPTVTLLLDQSGSMTADFNGVSRWTAMKNALTAAGTGILPTLESKIRFGAALYTSHNGGPTCPILKEEAPALLNAGKIKTLLANNSPDDDTPTGESIDAVVAKLKALPVDPDSGSAPNVIVIATDGEPDTCSVPDPTTTAGKQAAKDLSVNAAKAAFSAGYPIYILSVGSEIGAAHLQDMANAGVGVQAGSPNAPYYKADTPAQMVEAFNTIIRGVRTCTFNLNGSVDSAGAASGDVRLNGTSLQYNDPNGWSLPTPNTAQLNGSACTTFKMSDKVTLTASFACGTVIL